MRKYYIILCFSLTIGGLFAQNEQQKINEVKGNRNYLYATGTSTTSEEEASDNAQDLLAIEIEQWLKEKTTDDIIGYVAKSQKSLSLIKTQRGKLYRVFAFVRKKDVLPYYKEEDLLIVDLVEMEELQSDSIKIQESGSVPPLYVPNQKERLMINVRSFTELNEYINQGREDGSIIEVGKYANMPNEGVVYVFIHNREGEIPACMKVTDGVALNMASGKEELISNYKGCGAIWIKLKNE